MVIAVPVASWSPKRSGVGEWGGSNRASRTKKCCSPRAQQPASVGMHYVTVVKWMESSPPKFQPPKSRLGRAYIWTWNDILRLKAHVKKNRAAHKLLRKN